MLMTGDMIRIVSEEDKMFTLSLGKKLFNVRPGKDIFIPFELLCKDWGDPRSMTEKFRVPVDGQHAAYINSRHEVIERLSVLTGVYNPNNLDGYDGPDPMDGNKIRHFPGIKEILKKIKAYTLEGDLIMLPCDDPNCTQVGEYEDVASDAFMAKQLAETSARLKMLEQQMAYRLNQNSEEVASVEPDSLANVMPSDVVDNTQEDRPQRRPRVMAAE